MLDRNMILFGVGAVVTVAAIGYLVARKAGQTIAENVNLVNPNSPENVVNQGVSAVGRTLTGDRDFSLGGWLRSVTSDDDARVRAMLNSGLPAANDPIAQAAAETSRGAGADYSGVSSGW